MTTIPIDKNFSHQDLRGLDFSNANLSDANLEGANLSRAILKQSVLAQANFRGANLEEANLEEAFLQGANFEQANLTGTNFANTYLASVDFRGATLDRANFQRATVNAAQFEAASLKNVKWADISYDQTTSWPIDFILPQGKISLLLALLILTVLEGILIYLLFVWKQSAVAYIGSGATFVYSSRDIWRKVKQNRPIETIRFSTISAAMTMILFTTFVSSSAAIADAFIESRIINEATFWNFVGTTSLIFGGLMDVLGRKFAPQWYEDHSFEGHNFWPVWGGIFVGGLIYWLLPMVITVVKEGVISSCK